jgi:hypothetical protein
MFIRQRSTVLDPFLLKVVCPFLRSQGHDRLLAMLVNYWHPLIEEPVPRKRRVPSNHSFGHVVVKIVTSIVYLFKPLNWGKHSS